MSATPDIFLFIYFSFQMYMAIEALADGGVKMGIRRDLALKLAAQTLLVRKFFQIIQ